jgi:beta-glucosidase
LNLGRKGAQSNPSRVLETKFRLGLFDHPYVDPDFAERVNNSREHKELALEAARKSIVLLKNENNLLPLDLDKLKTVAVIGPNAADVHIGGYSRDPGFGISVLDGMYASQAWHRFTTKARTSLEILALLF